MAVILQVTSGPHAGRKTFLRPGQVMKVGRTEWSDFCLPRDAKLAEVHFALDCGYGICRIRSLAANLETLVNDKPVTEADVRHGDRIAAGESAFLLSIEEAASIIAPPKPAEETAGSLSGFAAIDKPILAKEVCEIVKLDEPALISLQSKQNIRKYFELLVAGQMPGDAIRFLAHALSKQQAIWWACLCVREVLGEKMTPKDKAAVVAAEAWVVDPSEAMRRAAIDPAEATNFDTPAGWCAGAAFWSGGSLTPPGLPVVAPKPTLTAEAVVVAIDLTTFIGDARLANGRKQTFLKLGSEVADGVHRWPAKPAEPAA